MRPTSLAARLLALTPRGRRLFALLAEQQAEIARLREALRLPPPPARADETEALRTLLRAAEAELRVSRAAPATTPPPRPPAPGAP